jgi:hypothetical protein
VVGNRARATEPAKEPIAGPFDIATASMTVAAEGDDGDVSLHRDLLDAEGRQMDQELGTTAKSCIAPSN